MIRDPRVAAMETQSPSAPATQTENPLTQAIPPAGSPEHAQYVQSLLDKIKELEQLGTTGGLPRNLGLRISPKGGVSVYGLNANFPVTLYPEQWVRLFEQQDKVLEFIEANKDLLEYKSEDQTTRARKEEMRRKAGIVARQPVRNIPRAA